jgi:hypothetical protein
MSRICSAHGSPHSPFELRAGASRGRPGSLRARRGCRAPGRSSPARARAPPAAACRRHRERALEQLQHQRGLLGDARRQARASSISFARGTTRLARPERHRLGGAMIWSPSEHQLLGAAQRDLADDALGAAGAGNRPSVISGRPSFASSARMRMSSVSSSSVPPPSAQPLMAPIVGLSQRPRSAEHAMDDLGELVVVGRGPGGCRGRRCRRRPRRRGRRRR